MELLETWSKYKQPSKIPMPFFGTGGLIVLSIYCWFYRTFFFKHHATYEETIKQLDTPWKVQAWLWGEIKYTADKTPADSWQPAERTFDRRKGDCEDWAIFSNACLRGRVQGYYLCMYTSETGHCDYLIKTGEDKYTSIGTYGLMYHNGHWDDIIPDWSGFKDWQSLVVLDEDLKVVTRMTRGGPSIASIL